jgi:hypothetical protein
LSSFESAYTAGLAEHGSPSKITLNTIVFNVPKDSDSKWFAYSASQSGGGEIDGNTAINGMIANPKFKLGDMTTDMALVTVYDTDNDRMARAFVDGITIEPCGADDEDCAKAALTATNTKSELQNKVGKKYFASFLP